MSGILSIVIGCINPIFSTPSSVIPNFRLKGNVGDVPPLLPSLFISLKPVLYESANDCAFWSSIPSSCIENFVFMIPLANLVSLSL